MTTMKSPVAVNGVNSNRLVSLPAIQVHWQCIGPRSVPDQNKVNSCPSSDSFTKMVSCGDAFVLPNLRDLHKTGCCFSGWCLDRGEPGSVLVLASEDDSDELHRRVHNTANCLCLNTVTNSSSARGAAIREVMVAADNLMTKALHGSHGKCIGRNTWTGSSPLAKQIPDLKLIIVDPASRFRGGGRELLGGHD